MILKHTKILITALVLFTANSVHAEHKTINQSHGQSHSGKQSRFISPYFAAGVGGGGETVATFSDSFGAIERVRSGGGFLFEGGVYLRVDPFSRLRFTGGYEIDGASRFNGDSTFDRIRFDAVYLRKFGPHEFGGGATLHTAVRFQCTIIDICSETTDFDDALGYTLEYAISGGFRSYQRRRSSFDRVRLGVRFTDIDYTPASGSANVSGFGTVDGRSLTAFVGFAF